MKLHVEAPRTQAAIEAVGDRTTRAAELVNAGLRALAVAVLLSAVVLVLVRGGERGERS